MTSSRKVFMIMDRQEEEHVQPWPSYHIEVPRRLKVIQYRLEDTGLIDDPRIEHIPRREATEEELLSVHTKRYVDDVKTTETMTVEEQEAFSSKYEDIYVNSATWRRAKLAAGSAIDLVTRILEAPADKQPTGIAFVRPPGHHAMPDAGCGFCIFNNVAIAAKTAIRKGLARKVLIVDYDVHAGNGTQECIEEGPDDIRLISIHRYEQGTFWPNLPLSGLYHEYQKTINVPLKTTGYGDKHYHAIFTHVVLPFCHSYRPDLILVSSGFDAARGDPEGSMNVSPAGFGTLMRMLLETGRPVAAILEGGYFLDALAAGSEWVLRAMLGEKIPRIVTEMQMPTEDVPNPDPPEIMSTIWEVLSRHRTQCDFFRKILQLRRRLHGPLIVPPQLHQDFFGERTVAAPFQTRDVYKPLAARLVEAHRSSLRAELARYKLPEKVIPLPDLEQHPEIPGFVGICDAGEIVYGSAVAKIFVALIFLAPSDSLFAVGPIVEDANFETVELDEFSMNKIKVLSTLKKLPIMHP